MTISAHGRSVGHAEPAAGFMEWLMRRWMALTDKEKENAIFEVRSLPPDDTHMVGFKWTDDAKD